MEEPFAERLRRLAREHGTSLERIFNEAYDPETRGTSPAQMKKIMRGEREVKPHTIEAIATALGVAPDEFPEYRLALARQLLDEREVGLDQALATLTRFETALQTAEPVAPRASRRASSSRRRAQGGES